MTFNTASPSIPAVSQWDLALTVADTCPDLIGSNDTVFSTGSPTVTSAGVSVAANHKGVTGITGASGYSIAYLSKAGSASPAVAVGGGLVGGTNFVNAFEYVSSFWHLYNTNRNASIRLNAPFQQTNYDLFFMSFSAAGVVLGGIYSRKSFFVRAAQTALGAVPITLCDADGVSSKKYNGVLADVVYWDQFIENWQYIDEVIWPYMLTLAVAKSITVQDS